MVPGSAISGSDAISFVFASSVVGGVFRSSTSPASWYSCGTTP